MCGFVVEIDPGLMNNIVNFVCVDDVGTVINPLLLKAQMHGGIVQGIGQALMEDIAYDADAQLMWILLDYALPRADDAADGDRWRADDHDQFDWREGAENQAHRPLPNNQRYD